MTTIRSCTSSSVKSCFIILSQSQLYVHLVMLYTWYKHSCHFFNGPNVFGKPANRLYWLIKFYLVSVVRFLIELLISSGIFCKSISSPYRRVVLDIHKRDVFCYYYSVLNLNLSLLFQLVS